MTDMCIRERDGWYEIGHYKPDERIARYVALADHASVEAVLNEQDIYLSQPGTEGEEDHGGEIEFWLVRVPDDILGWVDRLWFNCTHAVEVVYFE